MIFRKGAARSRRAVINSECLASCHVSRSRRSATARDVIDRDGAPQRTSATIHGKRRMLPTYVDMTKEVTT